jgi:hypothetical protein
MHDCVGNVACTVKAGACRWDLRERFYDDAVQVQVSDQPLTAFGVRDDGAVLGCGTADGCCSVMQLSSALVEMVPNEKQTINAMFERETLRCACCRDPNDKQPCSMLWP